MNNFNEQLLLLDLFFLNLLQWPALQLGSLLKSDALLQSSGLKALNSPAASSLLNQSTQWSFFEEGVGHNDDKVLILAATNTPYALDQAIRRRFDKRIYIPLPDLKARQHMFKVHLGDTPHNLNESDFEDLARRTEGFSGSDISVCVKDVLFEPVRKTQDAMYFIKTPNGIWIPCGPKQPGSVQITMQELAAQGLAAKIIPPPISKMDFHKVLARQRPTVSKSDLEVHERFTQEFGEEG